MWLTRLIAWIKREEMSIEHVLAPLEALKNNLADFNDRATARAIELQTQADALKQRANGVRVDAERACRVIANLHSLTETDRPSKA